mgnify:FL=1
MSFVTVAVSVFVAMGVFMLVGVFLLVAVFVLMTVFVSVRMLVRMLMSVLMGVLMGMAMTFLLLGRATWLWLSLSSTASPLFFMHLIQQLASILFILSSLLKFFNKLSQGYLIFWPSDQFCELAPEFVVGQILLLRLLLE